MVVRQLQAPGRTAEEKHDLQEGVLIVNSKTVYRIVLLWVSLFGWHCAYTRLQEPAPRKKAKPAKTKVVKAKKKAMAKPIHELKRPPLNEDIQSVVRRLVAD